MRTPYVVGNWKLHTRRAEARDLAVAVAAAASAHPGVRVGVAPPTLWLTDVVTALAGSGVDVYAQNAWTADSGAFTGETSPEMLAEAGVSGLIVGHSERRHVFGETDAQTGDKVARALAHGLAVILCVGETLDERDAGTTLDVVTRQLSAGCADLSEPSALTIAYEPVWAIGTGRAASPAQAQEVHASIRDWARVRWGAAAAAALTLQYGGSVKPANAAELLSQPDIDGALVGGASLDVATFAPILTAAAG